MFLSENQNLKNCWNNLFLHFLINIYNKGFSYKKLIVLNHLKSSFGQS